jgi:hypothetical protein
MDVLNAFSAPLKVAWVVWIAWGIAQVFWYRHERRSHVAAKKPAAAPARKRFVSKPSTQDRVVTRLVTPEQVIAHPAEPNEPAHAPVVDSMPGQVAELDQFVADFEMNTRQRRSQPLNGESFDTHVGG